MSQRQATIKVKGSRPMIINCFTIDAIPLERRERTGVAGNDPEEWKRSYKATEKGQLYVDPNYIFGSLREGAKFTRKGNRTLQAPLSSTLQILDEKILINRFIPEGDIPFSDEEPVYIDVRPVKSPGSRGRNIRYRLALSKGWETEFSITWDNSIISTGEMKGICSDAGQFVGLADGRTMGFGRFEILDFKTNVIGDKSA
ncbi:hypothetical protein ACFYS2_20750 [Bacillus velezensis]